MVVRLCQNQVSHGKKSDFQGFWGGKRFGFQPSVQIVKKIKRLVFQKEPKSGVPDVASLRPFSDHASVALGRSGGSRHLSSTLVFSTTTPKVRHANYHESDHQNGSEDDSNKCSGPNSRTFLWLLRWRRRGVKSRDRLHGGVGGGFSGRVRSGFSSRVRSGFSRRVRSGLGRGIRSRLGCRLVGWRRAERVNCGLWCWRSGNIVRP